MENSICLLDFLLHFNKVLLVELDSVVYGIPQVHAGIAVQTLK